MLLPVMSHKLDLMVLMTLVHTIDTDGVTLGALAGQTAVEVMHGVAVVSRDGVETLSHLYGLFQCPPVVVHLVVCGEKK